MLDNLCTTSNDGPSKSNAMCILNKEQVRKNRAIKFADK